MKSQKYIFATVLVLSSVVLLCGTVSAQSTTPSITTTLTPATKKPANIDQIKKRIIQRIDQRIQQLKQVNDRIQKSDKLSDDIKKLLSKEITTASDKLNTYKTDVANAADVQALMKLVSKVYDDKDFRTILNELSLLERYEKYSNLYTDISTLITKVQMETDAQKTAGKDVTALQTKLNEAKIKLSDTKTALDDILTILGGVKTDDTPGKNAALKKVRADLDTAKKNLRDAAAALKHTTGGLKKTSHKKSENDNENEDEKLSITPKTTVKPTESEDRENDEERKNENKPRKPTSRLSLTPVPTKTAEPTSHEKPEND